MSSALCMKIYEYNLWYINTITFILFKVFLCVMYIAHVCFKCWACISVWEKSKKIISFSVKGKECRICAAAKSKGNPPRVHQCCKNWTGWAKAMEPAMAYEMLEKVETSGGKVIAKYFYQFIKSRRKINRMKTENFILQFY